jgi:D-alanyl-D-alanine dipeptidase
VRVSASKSLARPRQRPSQPNVRSVIQRLGFAPIAQEWWHFSLRAEPFPTARFDFPVR